MIYCLRYFNVLLVIGKTSNDCVTDYLNFIPYCWGGTTTSIEVVVPPLFNVFCISINENDINI